jgi:16S rRNA (uracil1498-N3)-methyltransferase
MHYFYHPHLLEADELIGLSADESHHGLRVMRVAVGQQVGVLNGKGVKALATVEQATKKQLSLRITETEQQSRQNKSKLQLAFSPVKQADRNSFVVEKAVEIGVDVIFLFFSQNAERTRLNADRLERIAVAALKQSKGFYLPKIVLLKNFEAAVAIPADFKAIAAVPHRQGPHLFNEVPTNAHTMLLIGPEGGFTTAEIELAKAAGVVPVSLGPNVLRTETAAIAACLAVQHKNLLA